MKNWLDRINKVHIIGIGGTGTSGLARIFQVLGRTVQGSDTRKTLQTRNLEGKGIKVFYGHSPTNIDGSVDLVIRSQAVTFDNPECCRARTLKIPVISYPRALGLLMLEKRGVAVAGTHGKTTTSAIISFMLIESGCSPSFVIGGEIVGYGNSGVGNSQLLVVESMRIQTFFSEPCS